MNLMETLKITSAQNPIIKDFKTFNRRKTPHLICLDGAHLHTEYLKCQDPQLWHTLVSTKFVNSAEFKDFSKLTDLIEVPDKLMAKISPTKSPVGILSLASKPEIDAHDDVNLVTIFENIQDPGNMGTMLRSCLAMNVSEVLLLGDNTDIWSTKALRAGMGAQFNVPVRTIENFAAWKKDFKGTVMATSLDGDDLGKTPLPKKLALVFGNEGQGVSATTQSLADKTLKIPMNNDAESLNVASSLAILTYEWSRQHYSS